MPSIFTNAKTDVKAASKPPTIVIAVPALLLVCGNTLNELAGDAAAVEVFFKPAAGAFDPKAFGETLGATFGAAFPGAAAFVEDVAAGVGEPAAVFDALASEPAAALSAELDVAAPLAAEVVAAVESDDAADVEAGLVVEAAGAAAVVVSAA